MIKASQINDKRTTFIINKLINISKVIQKQVLSHFLAKCDYLHSIAFFQWRYNFPSRYNSSEKFLEESIQTRMKAFYQEKENDKSEIFDQTMLKN